MALVQAVALCATLLACADVTAAEKLGASDRRAIELTIRRQLDAFEHDDADVAFGFSSPDIQRLFGSSDSFMEMVRENYEPVYRPERVRFLGLEAVDRRWVQTVQVVDRDGKVWRALFTMKRQADKSWRIGGCQLVQTSAIAT
ncbi:MAG: DUF4864 domain-containing protein [Burkholderiaceae bacterium]